jgi:hypothetical protein
MDKFLRQIDIILKEIDVKRIEQIFYESGDLFLVKKIRDFFEYDVLGSKTKTFWYVDLWSIIHFISGIVFGYIYLRLNYDIQRYYFKLFVLHTIWELWQIFIGMSDPFRISGLNSLTDTIIDTVLFMFGTFVIRQYVNK